MDVTHQIEFDILKHLWLIISKERFNDAITSAVPTLRHIANEVVLFEKRTFYALLVSLEITIFVLIMIAYGLIIAITKEEKLNLDCLDI